MSGNDLIKFMTQQFVSYFDSPVEERKKRKSEHKQIAVYSNRWFGVLPYAFKSLRKRTE